jgi:hypothetical protein|eukprot:scaffold3972_cov298-Alexandrium_tamarense.AAC.3
MLLNKLTNNSEIQITATNKAKEPQQGIRNVERECRPSPTTVVAEFFSAEYPPKLSEKTRRYYSFV